MLIIFRIVIVTHYYDHMTDWRFNREDKTALVTERSGIACSLTLYCVTTGPLKTQGRAPIHTWWGSEEALGGRDIPLET